MNLYIYTWIYGTIRSGNINRSSLFQDVLQNHDH